MERRHAWHLEPGFESVVPVAEDAVETRVGLLHVRVAGSARADTDRTDASDGAVSQTVRANRKSLRHCRARVFCLSHLFQTLAVVLALKGTAARGHGLPKSKVAGGELSSQSRRVAREGVRPCQHGAVVRGLLVVA